MPEFVIAAPFFSKIKRVRIGTNMKNLRKYGDEPFNVAVIHGGPGAPGKIAPVARDLSSVRGVLEPLQTASTLEGQIEELRDVLAKNGNLP